MFPACRSVEYNITINSRPYPLRDTTGVYDVCQNLRSHRVGAFNGTASYFHHLSSMLSLFCRGLRLPVLAVRADHLCRRVCAVILNEQSNVRDLGDKERFYLLILPPFTHSLGPSTRTSWLRGLGECR